MSGTSNWSNLTPVQQQAVLAWMPLFRSAVVELVSACNGGSSLDGTWTGGISAIVESLASGTIIPDATGLAGAQPLTMDAVVGQMAAIEALLAGANTSSARAAYQAVVGPANMG